MKIDNYIDNIHNYIMDLHKICEKKIHWITTSLYLQIVVIITLMVILYFCQNRKIWKKAKLPKIKRKNIQKQRIRIREKGEVEDTVFS
uniref:Uncharacterized protein n=1 Tax=Meloidogyne enterolobii TaxID=390850 RepID=A0A6V7UJA3_MELEN|nr:unnamed protein product [Meloidogyne enterolobii]